MRSRAFRRAQQQRMTDKALRHLPWVNTEEQAKRVSNNMKVCSCSLCSSYDAPQFSTMKQNVSTHQQLEELLWQ